MFAHQHDVISLIVELKIDPTSVREDEVVASFKLLPNHLHDKTGEIIKMAAIRYFLGVVNMQI
jgi:hypothetical protein